MNICIVYDSLYGNTEKIAKEIAAELTKSHSMLVMSASQTHISDILRANLLIVGSPTHGGRPTIDLQNILDQIPVGSLNNILIAAFDTRFDKTTQNIFLRLLMKSIGYAAPKIQMLLEYKGGKGLVPPEGFIVNGKNGPLGNGELARARIWAKKIITLQK